MQYGPKNLILRFDGKNLTHFGGVYLLHLFFKRIELRHSLYRNIKFAQHNNRYTVAEEMLALIYPISLGLGRIETTHLLKHNGVFQCLTGLPTYPNPTTLRCFLLRMAPLGRRLHDRLLLSMILKPRPPTKIIFDLDSTVLILYGKQEMARIGYNPKKWGRPSYHPLLCFNGITKDLWHGELRPGNTHTATGTVDLLKTSFARLPSSVKIVTVQADKGFYDHETIIPKSSFRHCGQAYRSSQKRNLRPFLPGSSLWSGDCGIYVSTHEMEKEISFCGDQTSHPRRPYGTTYPFLDGQIQLPGSCDRPLSIPGVEPL